MKNAIQTNSHRNPQHKLGYFTPLSLLLILSLLIAQPAFAQDYNWERDSRRAQREVEENYGSGGKLSKEIKKNMTLQKDAVQTTDKDLEKILTPDMKKVISAIASLEEKVNKIKNDPNITQVKKQNLLKEISDNYLNDENKKLDASLGKELKIPVSIPGVKVFDFKKDKIITHMTGNGDACASYLLGYYAGYPIYAYFTATEEFMRNADRGRYNIDGIIHAFRQLEFKQMFAMPDIVDAFNPTVFKDFPVFVYMLFIQQKSAKEQKIQTETKREEMTSAKEIEKATQAKTIKPSFNCAKAGTPTEKTICSDAELAKLDATMAEDYKCLLGIDGDEQWKISQKEFIKKRDKCGDKVECIKAAYKNRFNEFSNSTGTMHKSCGYGP